MHSSAHKRKAGGSASGGGEGPTVLILAGLVLVIISGGYYFGGKVQQRRFAPVTADSHFKENALRREMSECDASLRTFQNGNHKLTQGVGNMRGELESLQAKSGLLFSRHEKYEQEVAECSQKAELERKEYDEETARVALLINEARDQLEQLRSEVDTITDGRGTRLAVDLQALKSMRKLNLALRSALQKDLPVADDTLPTIEAELLTKWGTYLDDEALFGVSGRRMELMSYVRSWKKWEYDQTVHTEIIPISRGLDHNVERALWHGHPMKKLRGVVRRQQRPPLTKKAGGGGGASSSSDAAADAAASSGLPPAPLPEGTLSETILRMYSVALCSYRANATRMQYPINFDWSPRGERASLYGIIDTPVLTLCADCKDPATTTEFALACGGGGGPAMDSSSSSASLSSPSVVGVSAASSFLRHYGSYPFWSMRSLLRFSTAVYNEADRFMAEKGLEEGAFTAVVNHVSEDARLRCHRHEHINYGPHRLWIERNYGKESIRHVSDDREEQCMPSEHDLREVLEKEAKNDNGNVRRGGGGGDSAKGGRGDAVVDEIDALKNPDAQLKVYMSAPDLSADRVESDSVRLVSYPVASAFGEAVDMVIASRAKRLIVSPFFAHSQIVTELFLLANDLDPQDITFF